MELGVELVPNSACNEIYKKDRKLPLGIIESQFCVKSTLPAEEIPDYW